MEQGVLKKLGDPRIIASLVAALGLILLVLIGVRLFSVTSSDPGGAQVSLDTQLDVATLAETNVEYPAGNNAGLLPVQSMSLEELKEALRADLSVPASWTAYNTNTERVSLAIGPEKTLPEKILSARISGDSNGMAEAASLGGPVRAVTDVGSTLGQTTSMVPAVSSASGSWISGSIFVTFIFPLLLIAILIAAFWVMQRGRRGKFGASSAAVVAVPATRFSDVAGAAEAVEDLKEAVDILLRHEEYAAQGVTIPRGALLMGPPGTGKTLLARAVAGEAGVPFYSLSGSDFVEMFVGVGASRVRSLFTKARKHANGAIIFIDEIDSLGKARSPGGEKMTGHNGEQEATLNALLVELDGFSVEQRVFVIGATNRPDLLDSALTRPGRLERQVHVGLADRAGREAILETHIEKRKLTLDTTVNLARVASRTPGMSGAELERVVNEASLSMVRAGRSEVTGDDFDAAIALVIMGRPRHSALVTERDRQITAWHEAGHTTAGLVLEDAETPMSVSIIPRGPAGGVTWFAGRDDSFLSRPQAKARLVVALAGRAAEEMLLDGEFTSGPHGDLQSATELAFSMVAKLGMVDSMLTSASTDMAYVLANDIRVKEAVNALMEEALDSARSVLAANIDLFHDVVAGLLERDTLNHDDLTRIHETHRDAILSEVGVTL